MEILETENELLEKNFENEIIKIGSKIIPESEITREYVIGEGAFGKVYKGKYLENSVAIKKIKLREKTQEILDILLNEIKVIKKADNPNIPKFYGIMKRKNHYNLIFEFISGKTLKDLYPNISNKEKISVLYDLSEILEQFHSKQLIHRDIKPGNIMINDDKKVKLIDFGISKIASHTSTFTRAQIGTILYMSPEQFQIDLDKFSDPNIDDVKPVPISIKSDIWSFGVMTSEIFSGVKPYHNISKKHAPTEQMITRRLIGNKPFPIPENLDKDVREIVERATVVDPEERANMSEIRERFRKLMEMRQNNNNYVNNNNGNNNNENNNNENNNNENHEINNNENNINNNINNINNNDENNKMEETL